MAVEVDISSAGLAKSCGKRMALEKHCTMLHQLKTFFPI
jgi:hypothetical protein